jgi:transcriptional regulator with PAS, ATPase and Fis domain
LAALDTGDTRWRASADKARKVLDKGIPILIQGESGVGKELFARALHDSSARKSAPFVAINCAAIAENLIEAELFGYAPGAFTGARKEGSLGRFREAQGGTVFLDEIGDMPLALQTRLLRVLQERKVTPVGSGKAMEVDFALVCATHCKLREAAERGSFRQDLYYRINGLTVQLPALRERDDFAALTAKLLRELHPQAMVEMDAALLNQLAAYPWPGNLRQYANMLRTACAMLDADETHLEWRHLPDDITEALMASAPARSTPEPETFQNLEDMSRAAIHQALENARGNLSAAARTLGISRQTLYRKLAAEHMH